MKKHFLLAVIAALLFTAAGASPPGCNDVNGYAIVQSYDDLSASDQQQLDIPQLQVAILNDEAYSAYVQPAEKPVMRYGAISSITKPSNIPLSAYKVNRMKNSK